MISSELFKAISYNNCTIMLEDYEADYIHELLCKEKFLNENTLSKALLEFSVNSDKRYFKVHHIKEISKNIFEAIGRSYDSDTLTGNLSKQRNLADMGIFYDGGIYLDDDILNFNIDGEKHMRKVSNEDESNVIAHKLIKLAVNNKK
tara:strand:- start:48 stop:488 length:441 start_codon:yes stop_codon:yes gene_type:complete